MTGEAGGQNITELQSRIAADFENFGRLTQEETAFLGRGMGDVQKDEFDRIARMHELYDDMTRRYEALLTMREAGQGEAAARVFFRDIDRDLNEKFGRLIDDAIAGEIAEVEAADREAQQLVRTLAWGIGLTSAFVLLATLVAGFFLYRSIVRPIRRLSAGAIAIGRGDLSFRVGALGADELGLLALRFDEMAGRIEEQQKLLLAARSNLEEEVLARTQELESANETLRDRDRSRVRFLADISHELRTPLTVLRGEAEVTLRGKSSSLAGYRETLERIVEQAREMARLVEDLLTLARSETDEIRFEKASLDLGTIAAEAVREAEILARPRDVRIDVACGGGLIVQGDAQRMKQVLMIVLDNAVKYSERSGTVRLHAGAESGAVVLTVRNKPGAIDEEELPRLFDRFYRGRDAAMASGGSGLGLAIARWMVEKQGGTIALERDGGDGIRVAITFPVALSPEGAGLSVSRKQPVAAH
jgi:signal transduction histidine kinase